MKWVSAFVFTRTGVWLHGAAHLFFFCMMLCSCHSETGLHSRVVSVEGGYGYMVLCGQDTVIFQPYVPAVGRRVPFATMHHAQAVGKLVCRKLSEGLSPAVTREEVEALGASSDGKVGTDLSESR